MTPVVMVSVSSPIPPLLLAGKLAVEKDVHPPSPGLNAAAFMFARHLVPVAVPPSCPECNGSGKGWYRNRDDGPVVMEITDCHDCKGSGFYTGDATFTAECERCKSFPGFRLSTTRPFLPIGRCPGCEGGGRPVASGRIEAVLKIEDLEDGIENDHEHPHVCVLGDSVLVLKLTYGPSMDDDTDVSHLSALLPWSSFPFALLVSGVVPA